VKVAAVHNRDSKQIVDPFGRPDEGEVGPEQIERITGALREGALGETETECLCQPSRLCD
jgi:hypothetical protein